VRRDRVLPGEQPPLSLHPPPVAAKRAALAHHAVAGDDERDTVVGAGAGDGAHRARRSDRRGELRVRPRLPVRDLAQRAPHPLLERRAARVQREGEPAAGAVEVFGDREQPLAELAPRAVSRVAVRAFADVHPLAGGVRELGGEGALELRIVVAERDGAHAALGGRHEHSTDGARGGRVADVRTTPPAPVGRRRHAQVHVRSVVGTAARAVARVERCTTHGGAAAELRLEPLGAQGSRVSLGRHAHQPLEGALQVVRAHPRHARQHVESHRLVGVRVQVGAGARYDRLRGGRRVPRVAATAGPKAGRLRRVGRRKEGDVRPQRATRSTARAAIDARGRHGVDEAPVQAAVPRRHRRPGRIVVERAAAGARADARVVTLVHLDRG
jgi:hypothetical protein